MKKSLIILGAGVLLSAVSFGQAVKDRNIIPVAVNLNQVLRMNITNGGNIEFMFNSVDDYKNGISGDATASSSSNPNSSDPMYVTDFTISSSTRWKLTYGSEQATFIGADNPSNTLALNNVGFGLIQSGVHVFEAAGSGKGTTVGSELFSAPTDNANAVSGLDVFPTDLIEDNDATTANAGDETDNAFQLVWRCGTSEGGMNTAALIDQSPSPTPDRYVTNVLFELALDN